MKHHLVNPHTAKKSGPTLLKIFHNRIKKHFPPNHNLYPVFNKKNVKVSYSCMPNMGSIINNRNKKILTSVIYKANVTTGKDDTGKNYIGLTEGTFKQRYT